jgi:hypothetical protein
VPRSGSSSGILPLIPPPPRNQPIQRLPPPELSFPTTGGDPTESAAPPSKEDLAALDALLNPRRNDSGAVEPLDRSGGDWEPRFAPAATLSGGGRKKAASSGPNVKMLLLGAVALAVLAGGGFFAWMHFGKTPAGTKVAKTAASAQPKAPQAETKAPATPAETSVASETATQAPATKKTAAAPTASRAPATAPPSAGTAGPGGSDLASARTRLRGGQYREAANAFAAHLRAARGALTIQLLVACSDDTVRKAADSVSQDELYIVPIDYKGRSCYRIGWGLYDSEARATSAIRSLPDYFRQPGVTPRVVSASTFLQ